MAEIKTVAVVGLPGSGKTTLLQWMFERTGLRGRDGGIMVVKHGETDWEYDDKEGKSTASSKHCPSDLQVVEVPWTDLAKLYEYPNIRLVLIVSYWVVDNKTLGVFQDTLKGLARKVPSLVAYNVVMNDALFAISCGTDKLYDDRHLFNPFMRPGGWAVIPASTMTLRNVQHLVAVRAFTDVMFKDQINRPVVVFKRHKRFLVTRERMFPSLLSTFKALDRVRATNKHAANMVKAILRAGPTVVHDDDAAPA